MVKKDRLFWLIIVIIWIFLAVFIFKKSSDIKSTIKNMPAFFEKINPTGFTIFNEPIGESKDPMWYNTCIGAKSENKNYRLTPDCESTPVSGIEGVKTYNIKINSEGFRGREYDIEKPENTYRIIVLGDSFTFGWGLNLEETFCDRLEKILNKKHDKNFEVLNFGVPGMNTALEVELFKEKALKYNPDLVIIAFLDNDDESIELYYHFKNCSKAQLKTADCYGVLKNNKNLKSIEFIRQPLEELRKISEESDFDVLIYAFDTTHDQREFFEEFEKYNKVYFQKSTSKWDNKGLFLHPLDQHPSAEANEIFAQEIYEIIIQYDLQD